MTRYILVTDERGNQGTIPWLQFRRGKISASMAPTIMNVSPYETKLQLFESIVQDIPKPKTDAMERGNRLEPKARAWVNETLGVSYYPAVAQSYAYPDFIASLDGLRFDDEGNPHILEIKLNGRQTHLECLRGAISEHHFAQMHHQMDLMGVNEMKYCSFDGEKGVILDVERDEQYCQRLFAEELRFLAALIDFKPPDAVGRDWIEINDPELLLSVSRLKEINEQISLLEERKENIRKELIFDHPRIKIGNTKVQRIVRRGVIEYGRIEALQGLDLEPYRKPPTTSVRIYE